jgi:hypothetical protein
MIHKTTTPETRTSYATLAGKLIEDRDTTYFLRGRMTQDEQREPLLALTDARKLLALCEARYQESLLAEATVG